MSAAARQSKLEVDVGIAEYVTPAAPGIGGKLKRLHTDFCVNEIDVNGTEIQIREEEEEAEGAAGTANDEASDAPHADDEHVDSDTTGDGSPGCVRFTLRKEKMDTLGAVSALSSQLGVPVRCFGFAGLKDHRAVTAQELTVRGVTAAAVRAAHGFHANCAIAHVRPAERQLRLGELGGNRFRILLRGVFVLLTSALWFTIYTYL